MYKHILIATDGSELAAKAVAAGVQLAAQLGARTTVVTVTEPFHTLSITPHQVAYTPNAYAKHSREFADQILDAAQAQAKAAGILCDPAWIEHEHPYAAIIEAAETRACDLIIMASHGRRGVAAIVLGSQTVKVLTHSSVPVLVYR